MMMKSWWVVRDVFSFSKSSQQFWEEKLSKCQWKHCCRCCTKSIHVSSAVSCLICSFRSCTMIIKNELWNSICIEIWSSHLRLQRQRISVQKACKKWFKIMYYRLMKALLFCKWIFFLIMIFIMTSINEREWCCRMSKKQLILKMKSTILLIQTAWMTDWRWVLSSWFSDMCDRIRWQL